jgi:hypothetical protein
MKKYYFIIILIFNSLYGNAQVSIETLRKEYHNLNTDSAACAKLYEKIAALHTSDNLILGYKGATTAAMANFVKAKTEKIKLFNEGKKILEQSIKNDSSDTELRFLRFTIQTNAPKALGYHKQIENDKKHILTHYNEIRNITVKGRISEYLLSSNRLNEQEKKKIKSSAK